jgi:hypothetical protein
MLQHELISKKGGTRGRKPKKQRSTSTADPSLTTKTKRGRQHCEKASATSTIPDTVRVSGNKIDKTHIDNRSSDNDESDDDSLSEQPLRQVAV